MLAKVDATNYNTKWSTPFTQAIANGLYLPLTGGQLTGNLTFSADNTRDIGSSGAVRPRDLFLGRDLVVGGTVYPGGSNQSIATPGYAGLQLRTVTGGPIFIASYAEAYVGANIYNNLAGWHRNQAGSSAMVIQLGVNAFNVLYAPSSAPDPISSFTTLMSMDNVGKTTYYGDLKLVAPGNRAIFFSDDTHYLQHAPSGATNVLAWTHDFETSGYLKTNSGVIRAASVAFRDAAGSALINVTANDYNGQSISLLQGSNQVMYWRDASHYLQYAPSGDTTLLAFTHDFEAANFRTAGFTRLTNTASGQISPITQDSTLRMRWQDAFTLANGANRPMMVGKNDANGIYFIQDMSDGAIAIVGTNNPNVTISLNHGSACGTGQNDPGKYTVFWSGNVLYLQNNRGSTHTFAVMGLTTG